MAEITYFRNYGPQNTDEVIKAVRKRVERNDIGAIVVASTSGTTGVKFLTELKNRVPVVVVSHKEMQSSHKDHIIELGGKAVDKTHLPLHTEGMDDVRETFRTLGQGFKVAVEVILIAADKGLINPYQDVVGIGGTGTGADTALIARATPTKEIFNKNENKKLEIREILAMPLKKKWWG